MKRPAFQWYPGDWRRDTALMSCSIEARGLWIEMLNLMHDGEPYGHLTAGGVPIDAAALGNLTGIPAPRLRVILKELEDRRIFSRTADGIIYSRRMVRDEAVRTRRAAGGKLGGNPALLFPKDSAKDNAEDGGKVNHHDNQSPTPATATATTAVATASKSQVGVFAAALSDRANSGLAEHPTAPQSKPLIVAGSRGSLEAAAAMLAAGVPTEFAEQRVFELARSHVAADGAVSSLNYFREAVIRAWNDQGTERRRRRPSTTVGEQVYEAALRGTEDQ